MSQSEGGVCPESSPLLSIRSSCLTERRSGGEEEIRTEERGALISDQGTPPLFVYSTLSSQRSFFFQPSLALSSLFSSRRWRWQRQREQPVKRLSRQTEGKRASLSSFLPLPPAHTYQHLTLRAASRLVALPNCA